MGCQAPGHEDLLAHGCQIEPHTAGRGVTAADVAAVPSPYIQLPAQCDPLVLVCSDEQGTMRPQLCKVGSWYWCLKKTRKK